MSAPVLQVRYLVTAADIWGPAAELHGRLTEMEMRVLRHAAQGLSDKQIAGVMQRHPNTVRNHMVAVRKKLNVRTRFQLALTVYGVLTKDRGDA
jgi:DNA-binding CsgD family transcriptional regulator